MAAIASDVKNNDTTDAGFDIAMYEVASPITARGSYVRLDVGSASTTITELSTSNPLPVSDAGGSLTVDNAALSVTGGGVEASALRVTIASDSTGVVSIDDNGSSITVDGTVAVSGTVTVGSHAVTNAGTFAVQVDGSALTALQLIDNTVLVDDAAFTPATSSVNMAGYQADESSTDSVDEGDAGAARMTLDRKQIVTVQPHTKGGVSIFRSLDLDETEEDIKTSAGQLYGFYAFNAATSIRYLKFYNATAANVTVGSTTPALTIPIPAATSGGVGMVFSPCSANGIPFDTAITAAATTGLADNDTGAPSANDVVLNAFYL